jgi:hypothetical protein
MFRSSQNLARLPRRFPTDCEQRLAVAATTVGEQARRRRPTPAFEIRQPLAKAAGI